MLPDLENMSRKKRKEWFKNQNINVVMGIMASSRGDVYKDANEERLRRLEKYLEVKKDE